MTAYNNDILLSATVAMSKHFVLEPCEAPSHSQDWRDEPLQEGDLIAKYSPDGLAWYRLVVGQKDNSGRATRNYHTKSGGDWKLGHRD